MPALLLAQGKGDWVRMKDGKILELVKRAGDRAQIVGEDGKKQIIGWDQVDGVLRARDARLEVDKIVRGLREKDQHDAMASRLKKLGPAAVPELVKRYGVTSSAFDRAVIMACFQHAWSGRARPLVVKGLSDPDPDIRRFARSVADLHFSRDDKNTAYRDLKNHTDPGIAGPGLYEELRRRPTQRVFRP
ncbi:MAG: hypothetical protein AAF492_27790, partial [Verrucomicrobiota bacterium]